MQNRDDLPSTVGLYGLEQHFLTRGNFHRKRASFISPWFIHLSVWIPPVIWYRTLSAACKHPWCVVTFVKNEPTCCDGSIPLDFIFLSLLLAIKSWFCCFPAFHVALHKHPPKHPLQQQQDYILTFKQTWEWGTQAKDAQIPPRQSIPETSALLSHNPHTILILTPKPYRYKAAQPDSQTPGAAAHPLAFSAAFLP